MNKRQVMGHQGFLLSPSDVGAYRKLPQLDKRETQRHRITCGAQFSLPFEHLQEPFLRQLHLKFKRKHKNKTEGFQAGDSDFCFQFMWVAHPYANHFPVEGIIRCNY